MHTANNRQKKTKKTKTDTRKTSSALARCHTLINQTNKHLSRKKVLSSGRKLPAEKEWCDLTLHCEIAHKAYSIAEMNLHKYEQLLIDKLKRIESEYRREPNKLHNNGDYLATREQITTMRRNYERTKLFFDDLKSLYKRSTGRPWTPRIEAEKPL